MKKKSKPFNLKAPSEIIKLRAENLHLRHACADLQSTVEVCKLGFSLIKDENAELKKDKERLDAFEKNNWIIASPGFSINTGAASS